MRDYPLFCGLYSKVAVYVGGVILLIINGLLLYDDLGEEGDMFILIAFHRICELQQNN